MNKLASIKLKGFQRGFLTGMKKIAQPKKPPTPSPQPQPEPGQMTLTPEIMAQQQQMPQSGQFARRYMENMLQQQMDPEMLKYIMSSGAAETPQQQAPQQVQQEGPEITPEQLQYLMMQYGMY